MSIPHRSDDDLRKAWLGGKKLTAAAYGDGHNLVWLGRHGRDVSALLGLRMSGIRLCHENGSSVWTWSGFGRTKPHADYVNTLSWRALVTRRRVDRDGYARRVDYGFLSSDDAVEAWAAVFGKFPEETQLLLMSGEVYSDPGESAAPGGD